ncbi:DUF2198 family protein [Priestia koreensis]|uniref:DUF2198 family protein n=1 Tax=Priestia koreensis TaxID=284581 RepID=UPI001F58603D|nr:DUF2198 family protein [Priestia koreensis]MCM3004541.1 CsbA family protein [Priestia koreensis]UNL84753.1 DUF2198 family protein [Priestia koreensis]
MLIKLIVALIVPWFLVILFARVTYNLYVSTALTAMLIVISIYKGYANYPLIVAIDTLSLLLGVLQARNMIQRMKKSV